MTEAQNTESELYDRLEGRNAYPASKPKREIR
jgi:hypothetical protein